MSDLWKAQKDYIDSAASCEAWKIGAIVTCLMAALSVIYGINICMMDAKIGRLEQRVKEVEDRQPQWTVLSQTANSGCRKGGE